MSNAVAFSSAVLPAMGIARDLLTRTFSASLILVTTLASGILAQSEQTAPAPQPSTERPAATLDFQGSLAAARDLYASADYLAALDMLDRLVAAQPSPEDHQSIDLYRTFCFVALGRTREADETITAMISRDPLYHPADSEIPPRLRPMFSTSASSCFLRSSKRTTCGQRARNPRLTECRSYRACDASSRIPYRPVVTPNASSS